MNAHLGIPCLLGAALLLSARLPLSTVQDGAEHGASPPAPAASAAAPLKPGPWREFDFWVGEWDCYDRQGQLNGTNRIELLPGGSGLQEFWSGAGGGTGTSLNLYDAARGVWHQTWVDSAGQPLFLEGGLNEAGAMVLEGTRPGSGVAEIRHRVTWTPLEDGGVQQTWVASGDGGATWNTAADLRYARQGADTGEE